MGDQMPPLRALSQASRDSDTAYFQRAAAEYRNNTSFTPLSATSIHYENGDDIWMDFKPDESFTAGQMKNGQLEQEELEPYQWYRLPSFVQQYTNSTGQCLPSTRPRVLDAAKATGEVLFTPPGITPDSWRSSTWLSSLSSLSPSLPPTPPSIRHSNPTGLQAYTSPASSLSYGPVKADSFGWTGYTPTGTRPNNMAFLNAAPLFRPGIGGVSGSSIGREGNSPMPSRAGDPIGVGLSRSALTEPTLGLSPPSPCYGLSVGPSLPFFCPPPTSFQQNSTGSAFNSPVATLPKRSFKPMQMVFREKRVWGEVGGGISSSGSGGSSNFRNGGIAGPAETPANMTAPVTTPTLTYGLSQSCPLGDTSMMAMTPPELSLEEQMRRRLQGISLNYRGDIDNPHNRGDHVPDDQNTSLFLTNIPATATVGDLLRAIAALGPTGRVFSASVNPPDPARGHRRAAAKISFFTRPQAEWLKLRIDDGQLVMWEAGGHHATAEKARAACRIRAIWNRDKKAPRQCIQPNECRVLLISGPAEQVNYTALTSYFREKFYYELEDVFDVLMPPVGTVAAEMVAAEMVAAGGGGGSRYRVMEWRFASFQSQAIAAKMALNHEVKTVTVEYGRDPCEAGNK